MTNLKAPIHADLTDRAIFKLSGPDAATYLNGQISQDVRIIMKENVALYSVISTFKGKLEGDLFIRQLNSDGEILIDTDASQRQTLFARLDKYLIADDAEIIDVTDQFSLYFTTVDLKETCYPKWQTSRYGVSGIDLLVEKKKKLFNVPVESTNQWEHIRISNKIPKWGAELHSDILPADAALESRAISFTKGCYTGQEVISRMKSSGKTNRHLVNFESTKELNTPCDLFLNTQDTKPAATLTSLNSNLGLGYRTRKAQASTTFLTKQGTPVNIV